jgi:hypothetical protein
MAKQNSVLNGIFKGVWESFGDLNDDLRSGVPDRVIFGLMCYSVVFFVSVILIAIIGAVLSGGSSYRCLEYRDDGIRVEYNAATKTTMTRRDKTCMVSVHKDFDGTVEIR